MRSLLKATFNDWYEDRAQRMGAALAYYTIFALTPGLVIVMALAGLLLGAGAESQIIGQIRELIGEQGAAAIEATITSARKETLGPTGTALALIPLVFGLWGVFGELQDGLNTIFGVTPKPGRRVTGYPEGALPVLRDGGGHRLPPPRLPRSERMACRRQHLCRPASARAGSCARSRELRHLLSCLNDAVTAGAPLPAARAGAGPPGNRGVGHGHRRRADPPLECGQPHQPLAPAGARLLEGRRAQGNGRRRGRCRGAHSAHAVGSERERAVHRGGAPAPRSVRDPRQLPARQARESRARGFVEATPRDARPALHVQ